MLLGVGFQRILKFLMISILLNISLQQAQDYQTLLSNTTTIIDEPYTQNQLSYVTQHLQNIGNLDLIFMIDNTGSMGGEIEEVKQNVISIINILNRSPIASSIRYAVLGYRDYADSLLLQWEDFTNNTQKINSAIQRMSADGGGDFPEAAAEGFFQSVNANWRSNAIRSVIWVADAPPHDEKKTQFKKWRPQIQNLKEMGVIVNCICVRSESQTISVMKEAAQETRGFFISLTNSQMLVDIIVGTSLYDLDKQRYAQLIYDQVVANKDQLILVSDDETRVKKLIKIMNDNNIQPKVFSLVSDSNQNQQVQLKFQQPQLRDIKEGLSYLNRYRDLCKNIGIFCLLDRNIFPETGLIPLANNPYGVSLPVKEISINSSIVNQINEIKMKQKYVNTQNSVIQAQFVFPLSPGSAVTSFTATINNVIITAKLYEKQQAQTIYNQAVSRGDQAFLLDQETPDIFKMSVGNLQPNQEILIEIVYISQLKQISDHQLRFIIPTNVAPSTNNILVSYQNQNQIQNMDLSINMITTKDIDSLNSTLPSSQLIYSTEQIQNNNAQSLSYQTKINNLKLDLRSDFILDINLKSQQVQNSNNIYISQFNSQTSPINQSAVILTINPNATDKFKTQLKNPQNVMIFIDTSMSMNEQQVFDSVKQASKMLINSLNQDDTTSITVAVFSNKPRFLQQNKKLSQVKDQLLQNFDNLSNEEGGTNFYELLTKLNLDKQKTYHAFLISDGGFSNLQDTIQFVASYSHFKIHPIGIGFNPNYDNLNKIAKVCGTRVEFVNPLLDDLSKAVQNQIQRSKFPLLTVQQEWIENDQETSVRILNSPQNFTYLLDGSLINLYALIEKKNVFSFAFKLTARFQNIEETWTYNLQNAVYVSNDFKLNQIAAKSLIDDLELEIFVKDISYNSSSEYQQNQEILQPFVNQTIGISLMYNITSQYTSFVAVYSNQQQNNTNQQTNRTYNTSTSTSYESSMTASPSSEVFLGDTSLYSKSMAFEAHMTGGASFSFNLYNNFIQFIFLFILLVLAFY